MSSDCNSTGNNQWFYFSVSNMLENKEYTLSIVNHTKRDSLFNYGMGPAVYSSAENNHLPPQQEKGWRRVAKDVSYKKGPVFREKLNKKYYKLIFKISTKHKNDKLFIAHSYPYTFNKLNAFLQASCNREITLRTTIGKTVSKRKIECVLFTKPNTKKRESKQGKEQKESKQSKQYQSYQSNRKAIIVMARQHPGQTQGSYVCEGLMQKLISNCKQSEFLLKNYLIYVIPMVNPDGVVFGHYRSNLFGKDLNRNWNISEKEFTCPQVKAIRNFIQGIAKQREIRCIIDLHGHSKKLNSFFYGNPTQSAEQSRLFPFICSKLTSAVSFPDCTFAVEQYKKSAARVYLSTVIRQQQLQIYTYETSFYAYMNNNSKVQFTQKEWRMLGQQLINGLFIQLEHQFRPPSQVKQSFYYKYLQELRSNKQYLEMGNRGDSGSDSHFDEAEVCLQNDESTPANSINAFNNKQLSNAKEEISNCKSTKIEGKKGEKEIYSRPTRNIRFLEISRVNSVLPDKYQLGLQPMKRDVSKSDHLATPQILVPLTKRSNNIQTQTTFELIININCSYSQICSTDQSQQKTVCTFNTFKAKTKNYLGLQVLNRSNVLRWKSSEAQTIITFQNNSFKKIVSHKNCTYETPTTLSIKKQIQKSLAKEDIFKKSPPFSKDKYLVQNGLSIKPIYNQIDQTKKQTELFFNGLVKKIMFVKNQSHPNKVKK